MDRDWHDMADNGRPLGDDALILALAAGVSVSKAAGRAGIASKAADTLDRLMDDEKASVALGAAKAVLELGPRLREVTEIEERLTRLESTADNTANESAVRVIYDDYDKTANHQAGKAAGQTDRTDNNSGSGG